MKVALNVEDEHMIPRNTFWGGSPDPTVTSQHKPPTLITDAHMRTRKMLLIADRKER